MTPEELSDFKLNVDLWNYPDGSLVRKAAAHIDQQAAEVERLRSENRELKKTDVWANDVIKEHESLNARIKALEAWLVEERANLILEKIRGGSIITLQDPAERSANAVRQLQAEGKIGGGDGE